MSDRNTTVLVLGAAGMLGNAMLRVFAGSPGFAAWGSVRTAGSMRLLPAELSRAIREIVAKKLSPAAAAPKAVAAALPALLAEAQTYFRAPDADAVALVKQIREALHRLEGEIKQSVGVSVVPERS